MQRHEVVALDILPNKVAMLNRKVSPINDVELKDFIKNKLLNFLVTLDNKEAFKSADYVMSNELEDAIDKVYTRDLFFADS